VAKVIITGEIHELKDGRFTLWETYRSNTGEEWRRLWTVWSNEILATFSAGDWVELEGTLSTKVNKWTKNGVEKEIVDHNLNNPVLVQHKPVIPFEPEVARDLDDERKYGRAPF
jgi:hypothetical protein